MNNSIDELKAHFKADTLERALVRICTASSGETLQQAVASALLVGFDFGRNETLKVLDELGDFLGPDKSDTVRRVIARLRDKCE